MPQNFSVWRLFFSVYCPTHPSPWQPPLNSWYTHFMSPPCSQSLQTWYIQSLLYETGSYYKFFFNWFVSTIHQGKLLIPSIYGWRCHSLVIICHIFAQWKNCRQPNCRLQITDSFWCILLYLSPQRQHFALCFSALYFGRKNTSTNCRHDHTLRCRLKVYIHLRNLERKSDMKEFLNYHPPPRHPVTNVSIGSCTSSVIQRASV